MTRILLADDQRDVLEALRILLKSEGYQTEGVTSLAGISHALEKKEYAAVADGPELHARHHVGPGGVVSDFKNSGNRLDVADRGDDGLG